jgi:hypothetical protein
MERSDRFYLSNKSALKYLEAFVARYRVNLHRPISGIDSAAIVTGSKALVICEDTKLGIIIISPRLCGISEIVTWLKTHGYPKAEIVE